MGAHGREVVSDPLPHARKPCPERPWRKDVKPGRFPPERFRLLAASAEDMSAVLFGCHKSPAGGEFACAGFLLQGAAHNLGIRLAAARGRIDLSKISDGGFPLFASYRAMAVANGVDPEDPALARTREDTCIMREERPCRDDSAGRGKRGARSRR